MIVTRLITCYILWSIRLGIVPWRYFQLNSAYFNTQKGIYSKLEIDTHIPDKWRLSQAYLDIANPPVDYPIFLKPEWGQNSYGIQVIHSLEAFKRAYLSLKDHKVPYIVQTLAPGNIEYELFYIQDPQDSQNCATLTITQVENNNEDCPVNAIGNQHTFYQDITDDFNEAEIEKLKTHLRDLPCFKIARVGLKANNKLALLAGNFKIIEINLFAPMPLHLLDSKHSKQYKTNFIRTNMRYLVELSSKIPRKKFKPFIFWKKVRRHYQIK